MKQIRRWDIRRIPNVILRNKQYQIAAASTSWSRCSYSGHQVKYIFGTPLEKNVSVRANAYCSGGEILATFAKSYYDAYERTDSGGGYILCGTPDQPEPLPG